MISGPAGAVNAPDKRGRENAGDLRHVVNAMLYIARTDCQWRYLPGPADLERQGNPVGVLTPRRQPSRRTGGVPTESLGISSIVGSSRSR